MKYMVCFILLFLKLFFSIAQQVDSFTLRHKISNIKTITYRRLIEYDKAHNMYHVKDYFENGQMQLDAGYTKFDKLVKEEHQCNYYSNRKEGSCKEWYNNGQIAFEGTYNNGLRNGLSISWYENGQKEAEENWLNGQLHGNVKYWFENGELQFDLLFDHGRNVNPKNVIYEYLAYTPKAYGSDTVKKWPLMIYLHGGSDRGTDLAKLYSSGIPDQIYRGREFPFIVISPQCPTHIRFSTDDWFENFYKDITSQYRIDSNRVYLTGASLGGEGTWYLAAKYPGKFAAIAPMCGFTSHMDFIDRNIDKLFNIPIWAFHGRLDNVVPFEETERMIKKLAGRNKDLKFSDEPNAGHWIGWLVYPGKELYDWFLKYTKR